MGSDRTFANPPWLNCVRGSLPRGKAAPAVMRHRGHRVPMAGPREARVEIDVSCCEGLSCVFGNRRVKGFAATRSGQPPRGRGPLRNAIQVVCKMPLAEDVSCFGKADSDPRSIESIYSTIDGLTGRPATGVDQGPACGRKPMIENHLRPFFQSISGFPGRVVNIPPESSMLDRAPSGRRGGEWRS